MKLRYKQRATHRLGLSSFEEAHVWENVLPAHGKIQNPREQLNISGFELQGGTVAMWLLTVERFSAAVVFWLLRGSVVQVPERLK
jgi:hypothetical protein